MKTTYERSQAGQAFAMAAIYAARSLSVKLGRVNGQWVVEVINGGNSSGTQG